MESRVYCAVSDRIDRLAPPGQHIALCLLVLLSAVFPATGREKNKMVWGEGLLVEIPQPESEVEPVVEDVAQNGIIRGTKEYNKDEYVAGARAAQSCNFFYPWKEGGKVFYKVREKALDPRNFHDSQDEGTLAVRYVVKAEGDKKTILRIDALFKEDVRGIVHKSNGSVESEEYKDIREHLDSIALMKKEDAEAKSRREALLEKKQHPATEGDLPFIVADSSSRGSEGVAGSSSKTSASASSAGLNSPASVPTSTEIPNPPPTPVKPAPSQPPSAQAALPETTPSQAQVVQPSPARSVDPVASLAPTAPGQTLELRVKSLRKQVERLVKSPGAPLRSAPFHTASALATLSTGTEVLIVISTPYWYGVETHEGQHGWIMRDELENLP